MIKKIQKEHIEKFEKCIMDLRKHRDSVSKINPLLSIEITKRLNFLFDIYRRIKSDFNKQKKETLHSSQA